MSVSELNLFTSDGDSSSESGSNWSQPELSSHSRTHFNMPKRKSKLTPPCRSSKSKGFESSPNQAVQQRVICTSPHLQLRPYQIRLSPIHADLETAKALLEKINEQTMIVSTLYPLYKEATHNLEAEVVQLKQRVYELESEAVEIKRKRWCHTCLEEATYMRKNRFFCSRECEIRYAHCNEAP